MVTHDAVAGPLSARLTPVDAMKHRLKVSDPDGVPIWMRDSSASRRRSKSGRTSARLSWFSRLIAHPKHRNAMPLISRRDARCSSLVQPEPAATRWDDLTHATSPADW